MFIPFGFMNLQFALINPSAGQEALTAIGIQADITAFGSPGAVNTFLGQVGDIWDAKIAPYVSNIWEGESVRGVFPVEVDGDNITVDGPTFDGGTAGDDALPPNCSWLVKKQTFTAGRVGQGRMFIPSPTEGGVDSQGVVSTSQYAAFNDDLSEFLVDLLALDEVEDVVLFHNDEDLEPSSITALQLDRKIATQRRRLRD